MNLLKGQPVNHFSVPWSVLVSTRKIISVILLVKSDIGSVYKVTNVLFRLSEIGVPSRHIKLVVNEVAIEHQMFVLFQ